MATVDPIGGSFTLDETNMKCTHYLRWYFSVTQSGEYHPDASVISTMTYPPLIMYTSAHLRVLVVLFMLCLARLLGILLLWPPGNAG